MENSQWEHNNNNTAAFTLTGGCLHLQTQKPMFLEAAEKCKYNVYFFFVISAAGQKPGGQFASGSSLLQLSSPPNSLETSQRHPLHPHAWLLNHLMQLWDKPSTTDSDGGDQWIWPALCTRTKESGKISASGQRTLASFSKVQGPDERSYNNTECPTHVSVLISHLQINILSPHTQTNPITAILGSWKQQIHQKAFLYAQ